MKLHAPRGVEVQHHAVHRPGRLIARCLPPQGTPSPSPLSSLDVEPTASDPEAKFRRYGQHFGGAGFKVLEAGQAWMNSVPMVRVRTAENRKMEELLELAVLNERLSGSLQPWEVRRKLDYLRMRRKNWQRIYEYVTKQDTAATLAMIEDASRKVELALSEESKESNSVSSLKHTLTELQKEVNVAHEKLHVTQARVQQSLQRMEELKAETAALERMRNSPPPSPVMAAQSTASRQQGTETIHSTTNSTVVVDRPETVTSRAKQAPSSNSSSKPAGSSSSKTSSTPKASVGLESSLVAEDGLRNFWYPAEFSAKLEKNMMIPFDIFHQPWILFRDEHGQPSCIKDECAHRACPLSLGKVVDGQVECAYHGWQFNAAGTCTKMPSTSICRNVGVAALPCVEKDGFVWVYPGDGLPPEVPDYTTPPSGFRIHAEIVVDVPVEHGLLMENLLDLAHAPFTHTSTFARGWPVPDFVKFHTNQVLAGNWDPYPIEMSFQPPCMVFSLIGLEQPGKIQRGVKAQECSRHLHQLHICLPSKNGNTRLLYRMSLDFMQWIQYIPFIDVVWKQVAAQVLGEDLTLVMGQQERLAAGGNTWLTPVSYDKLAVRYRRWRNNVAAGYQQDTGPSPMSSGELFAVEEDAADGRLGLNQGDEEAEYCDISLMK